MIVTERKLHVFRKPINRLFQEGFLGRITPPTTTQISSPDNSRLLGERTLWLAATRIAACSMEGLRLLRESRRKLELDLEKQTVIPQSSLSDDPFSHSYPAWNSNREP